MKYLFAVGFIAILGQVVLLRELSVASYGIELIYTLAIGVWLFFSACGAMISRRQFHPSLGRINFLFILFSISLPLDIAFIRSVRLIFTNIPGAYLPFHIQMIAVGASILLPGLLLGLLFQWTAKVYIKNGKSLAAAYGIESLGGLAGGICATLFLKFGLQNFCIGLICSLCAAGAVYLFREERKLRWFHLASGALIATLMLLIWKAPALDFFMTSWTHPNLMATQDSPYSRITVTLRDGEASIFEDDALLSDTAGVQAEELVHNAALQHSNPDRILVMGGGVWGVVREALTYSPEIVDYVELNPALLEVTSPYLPSGIQKSFRNKHVRITMNDPRKFLKNSLRYDLMLSGMPEPFSGQANRFYTKEFFQQCFLKLNSNGVLAFSLQSSENVWTEQFARRIISVYRAAKSAFPYIMIIPGKTNIILCARQPLTKDTSVLSSRLQSRGIKTKLVSAAYIRYQYANDRFSQMESLLASGSAPMNTDVRPICYQYTLMIWLLKVMPSLKFFDLKFLEFNNNLYTFLGWSLGLSVPALWLSRTRWRLRRTILTAIAGFAGMVLETAIILHFQIKNGILYQDVGILLTGFMTGLSLGALFLSKTEVRTYKRLGAGLFIALAMLSAFIGVAITFGLGAGLVSSLLLLFSTGFLVAGIFGYASMRETGNQRDVITPLYSADLIGGCLGSVLTSLILAPIVGLDTTAHLMAPLAILALLLL
jgi:spermidine synthase